MTDLPLARHRKLTQTHKPRTLRARLRRALKVRDRFVRNLVRDCPDLLADFQQVLEAHNAVIEAVVGELNRERPNLAP
jgi:hypothetical protein